MRAKIARAMYYLACNGPSKRLGRRYLHGRGKYPINNVVPVEVGAGQRVALFAPSVSTITAPRWVGETPRQRRTNAPELNACIIRDAVVSAYTPGILRGQDLLLPGDFLRARPGVLTDTDGLFYYDRGVSVGRITDAKKIPAAIQIGGPGAFNWYHFALECLPKAFMAQRLPEVFSDLPLIVPAEYSRFPAFKEALDLLCPGRRVITLARAEYLQVEELVTIGDVSFSPFNLADGHWPEIADYHQHDAALLAFTDHFRGLVAASRNRGDYPKRIFLVREGTRRDYNQDALLEIATRYGFKPLAPETLSLAGQAAAFSDAEMILGASGAAWVGMIFCQQPARFLSWIFPEYGEFSSYSGLAELLGHRMDFLQAQPDAKLTSTRQAYRQRYRVDPGLFEQALHEMTGSC